MYAEFYFRVWLSPDDSPPEIEVFWPHLENTTDPSRRFVSDWCNEAMQNEDLRERFSTTEEPLDPDKEYQVVGKASVRGFYSGADGEYDEELDILEVAIEEVPAWYWSFNESESDEFE